MTPKEKAKEIYNTVNADIPINASFLDSAEEASGKIMQDQKITLSISNFIVDQIEEAVEKAFTGNIRAVPPCETIYWKSVRTELNKIK